MAPCKRQASVPTAHTNRAHMHGLAHCSHKCMLACHVGRPGFGPAMGSGPRVGDPWLRVRPVYYLNGKSQRKLKAEDRLDKSSNLSEKKSNEKSWIFAI